MAVRAVIQRSIPPTVAMLRDLRFTDGASLEANAVLSAVRWGGGGPYFVRSFEGPDRVQVPWRGIDRVLRLGLDAFVLTPDGPGRPIDQVIPDHLAFETCPCVPVTCEALESAVAYVIYGGPRTVPGGPDVLLLAADARALALTLGGRHGKRVLAVVETPIERLGLVLPDVACAVEDGRVRAEDAASRLRVAAGWWTRPEGRGVIARMVRDALGPLAG